MSKHISPEYLIKLLQLPKIGRKTALKIISNSDFSIESNTELRNAIQNQSNRMSLPYYSTDDFENAMIKADQIINRSMKLGIRFLTYWE